MLMIEKLESLGAKTTSIPEHDKNKVISKLQTEVGPLPDEYKELLIYFGGDIEFSGDVVFSSDIPSPWADDNLDQVDFLYGLVSRFPSASLSHIAQRYQNRLPVGWFPIGSAPGGNLICMNLKGAHEIAFWDHESEGIPTERDLPDSERKKGLFSITNSLPDFVSRLYILDTPSKVIDNVIVNLRF